jgi:hypothetical protein
VAAYVYAPVVTKDGLSQFKYSLPFYNSDANMNLVPRTTRDTRGISNDRRSGNGGLQAKAKLKISISGLQISLDFGNRLMIVLEFVLRNISPRGQIHNDLQLDIEKYRLLRLEVRWESCERQSCWQFEVNCISDKDDVT